MKPYACAGHDRIQAMQKVIEHREKCGHFPEDLNGIDHAGSRGICREKAGGGGDVTGILRFIFGRAVAKGVLLLELVGPSARQPT